MTRSNGPGRPKDGLDATTPDVQVGPSFDKTVPVRLTVPRLVAPSLTPSPAALAALDRFSGDASATVVDSDSEGVDGATQINPEVVAAPAEPEVVPSFRVPVPLSGHPSIEGFELVNELGWGAMGVVYEAVERATGRTVALKLIPTHADESVIQRFVQEAKIGESVDHPDVVRVYGSGKSGKFFWMSMERLYGSELSTAVVERRLSVEERLALVARVARALDHIHRQGILHRDVKPSNIYVTEDGGVKVLDFGIAKLPNAQLTRPGIVNGTPQYMAPEQMRGQPMDERTDIFSLGVLAYNLMAGSTPWTAENDTALMMTMCFSPARPFEPAFREAHPEIPAAARENLARIVHRAIATKPEERFRTMAELASALEAHLAGKALPPEPSEVEVAPTADLAAEEPTAERTARLWAIGGLVLAAAIVGLTLLLR